VRLSVRAGSVGAMNEPLITVQGHLGSDVTLREARGAPLAEFRLAVQPSWWDRRHETWVEGEAQWYDVTAWRALATHCADSLSRGQPVIVTGRLAVRRYVTAERGEGLAYVITASGVGHDLQRGTSVFTKAAPAAPPAAGASSETSAEGVVDPVAA
jgi:single-strand DNA-binding protein